MFETGLGLKGALAGIILVLATAGGLGEEPPLAGFGEGSALAPEYGTAAPSRTTITATSFYPEASTHGYKTSPSLGRYGDLSFSDHHYASLELPAGVIVDYIGLNNLNDGTDAVMTAALWQRSSDGTKVLLASVSSTPHKSWSTDFAGPFNSLFASHLGSTLILDVAVLPNGNPQYFGHVEVVWRRVVSGAPPTATFTDVPTTHPFFKFVEALHSAGITGGYPDGRFGVDDPITRGQMAVFLATALGLQWAD